MSAVVARTDLRSSVSANIRAKWSSRVGTSTRKLTVYAPATYEIRDIDAGGSSKLAGRELMEKGLLVTIPARPGAAIVFYKRLK